MHSHEHDVDAAVSLRPKGARLTEAERRWPRGPPPRAAGTRSGRAAWRTCSAPPGNAGVTAALADEERSPVHDVISSGGRPLDTGHPGRHGRPPRARLR